MRACQTWLEQAGLRFWAAAIALVGLAVPTLTSVGLHAGWYSLVPALFALWCVGVALSDRGWRAVHATVRSVRARRTAAHPRAVG